MPLLNSPGAYSAIVGPEVLQNTINIEDKREERLAQDRELARERKDLYEQKVEDLKIGTIKYDASRLNPMLQGDATSFSNKAFGEIADAFEKAKTSTDRSLAIDKVTLEFSTNLQGLYDESAQLNQIDPTKNPNIAQLWATNPELAQASQALVQSGYDKTTFQNLLKTVPNNLKEWSYFGLDDPNHDPSKPLSFKVTPPKQTDWTQLAATTVKGIKPMKPSNIQTVDGQTFGNYTLSDDPNSPDYKAFQQRVQTATHGDVGGFNNWLATKGYTDPDIWVNGKPPLNPDGTTNVNAVLDKDKAIKKYNDDFSKEAESHLEEKRISLQDKSADELRRLGFSEQLALFKQAHGIGSDGKTEGERAFDKFQAPVTQTLGNLKTTIADKKSELTSLNSFNEAALTSEQKERKSELEKSIPAFEDELKTTQAEYDKQVNNWALMQKYDMTDAERVQLVKLDTDELKTKLGEYKLKSESKKAVKNTTTKTVPAKKTTTTDDDFSKYQIKNLHIAQ